MKRLGRETSVYTADSKSWKLTNNNYLPGGVLSIFRGKIWSLINEEEVEQSKVGNWIAIPIQHNGKKVLFINIYRIPVKSTQGPWCSLTQYNVVEGNAKSSGEYRKEIFKEIKQYVNQKEDIDDIIIAGDLNQNVNANEIRQFFTDLGVDDVHSRINRIENKDLDKTQVPRSNPIDLIAALEGLMEFIEGSKLLSHNEIVWSDHRAYVIDVNFEDYFNEELSRWDNINHVILDPAKRSY